MHSSEHMADNLLDAINEQHEHHYSNLNDVWQAWESNNWPRVKKTMAQDLTRVCSSAIETLTENGTFNKQKSLEDLKELFSFADYESGQQHDFLVAAVEGLEKPSKRSNTDDRYNINSPNNLVLSTLIDLDTEQKFQEGKNQNKHPELAYVIQSHFNIASEMMLARMREKHAENHQHLHQKLDRPLGNDSQTYLALAVAAGNVAIVRRLLDIDVALADNPAFFHYVIGLSMGNSEQVKDAIHEVLKAQNGLVNAQNFQQLIKSRGVWMAKLFLRFAKDENLPTLIDCETARTLLKNDSPESQDMWKLCQKQIKAVLKDKKCDALHLAVTLQKSERVIRILEEAPHLALQRLPQACYPLCFNKGPSSLTYTNQADDNEPRCTHSAKIAKSSVPWAEVPEDPAERQQVMEERKLIRDALVAAMIRQEEIHKVQEYLRECSGMYNKLANTPLRCYKEMS